MIQNVEGSSCVSVHRQRGSLAVPGYCHRCHWCHSQAECAKGEHHGLQVCRVYVDEKDIGLVQIKAGPAWFQHNSREQTTSQPSHYLIRRGESQQGPTWNMAGCQTDSSLAVAEEKEAKWFTRRHGMTRSNCAVPRGSLLR